MCKYTAAEATNFFRSYGTECDVNEVKEWITNTPNLDRGDQVDEWDLYAFNNWIQCKGTAYEPGIDDKTKIERLLEEISELKKENEALKEEVYKLATDPEYLPF